MKKLEEYTELIDGDKIPDLHPVGHSDVKTCLFQFQAEEKLAATDLRTDHPDSGTHLVFYWLLTLTLPVIRLCFYFLSYNSLMKWCFHTYFDDQVSPLKLTPPSILPMF